jgi:hypothetical protein
MMDLSAENNPPAPPSAHVRFTESEYAHVRRDADLRGVSIPRLLKEAYFRGVPSVLLMGREEARAILVQMARLGNNLNQAVRALHTGGAAGGLLEPVIELMRLMNEVRTRIERGASPAGA